MPEIVRRGDHSYGQDRRAECLLDDAIEGSFPASDPIAAVMPGSVVSRVYAVRESPRRRDFSTATASWILRGIAVGLAAWFAIRLLQGRAGHPGLAKSRPPAS